MEVITAKTAGFCFGVKRAVNMVCDISEKSEDKIYTYGPIIHNEVVVKDLEALGVFVLSEDETIENGEGKTIVIRSHGVKESVIEDLKNNNYHVENATCPFVSRIHELVKEHTEKGGFVLVTGNKNHPEVIGICGYAKSPELIKVIDSEDDINDLSIDENLPVLIVSQTTQNIEKFQYLVEIIRKKSYNVNVVNTICNATNERQTEALLLAKKCQAMIVIGSLSSSNTRKLYEICQEECENTYYIQTIDDLDINKIQRFHSVGITAGASTPNKLIEEVQKLCQK